LPRSRVPLEAARPRKLTASETIKIDDGLRLVLVVQQPLPPEVAADRRWIVILQPTIYIEEEERARALEANPAK
jgi:hypothetical protein